MSLTHVEWQSVGRRHFDKTQGVGCKVTYKKLNRQAIRGKIFLIPKCFK